MTYQDLLWIVHSTWMLPLPFLFTSYHLQTFRWMTVCYVLAFVTEVIGMCLFYMKINPNYSITVYMVFSTIPISCFFYHAIGWKSLKTSFVIFNVVFFLFALIVALFIQKLSPNFYTITAQTITIIIFCILYFYKMLHDLPVEKPHLDPVFLMVCGWFITYAGKIVLSATGQYLYTILKDNMLVMWIIFNALTIIGNFIVTLGAYQQWKSVRNPTYNPGTI